MLDLGQLYGRSFHSGSSFLEVAFDRFESPELLEFLLRWKIGLDEVESLKQTSAMVDALLDEAEVKQFADGSVKLWLDHLKQLLYDAEDILDEYATELLCLKLESAHQTQQVRYPVPLEPSGNSVSSLWSSGLEPAVKDINGTLEGIKSKVRNINKRLISLAQEGVALGLNSTMRSRSSRPRVILHRPPASSLGNGSMVFGRFDDMEKIVGWLLSDKTSTTPSNDAKNLSVLPIVGVSGIGKTTLARLVYNDERVDEYFGLKTWVSVLEDFDVMKLTKEILESATGSSPPKSLYLQQLELIKILSKKRFLLVLDDMREENYGRWDTLSRVFAFCTPESKILITTRNKSVASMVRTTPNDYDLKGLSDEACLALFRRHAFMDENITDANGKLEIFGEEIVKKCKGLPLAIKALAGLLRDRRGNDEWEDILHSEIWDLKQSSLQIPPSLMLSYLHLPPLLKRCFAYCALFPKDFEFNLTELVLLWMAEGLVKGKGRKRPEDIGAEFFDELFMRSFLELSYSRPDKASPFTAPAPGYYLGVNKYDEYFSRELYIRPFSVPSSNTRLGFMMHDLIHDLAQFVLGGIYCRREYDKPPPQVLPTTRHFFSVGGNSIIEAVGFGGAMKRLRTMVLHLKYDLYRRTYYFSATMQFQFKYLRVLRIRNFRNPELPDSIGKLKHLRLLDFSFSDVMSLPNSITCLYNLQTLVLIGCWWLRKLPENMGNLVNLRHLFLPALSRDSYKLPLGIGKLRWLWGSSVLHGNQQFIIIKQAPRDLFGDLKGLCDLDLSATSLEVSPHSLVNLPRLQRLKLCHRELSRLPLSHTGNRHSPPEFSELRYKKTLGGLEKLEESLVNVCSSMEAVPSSHAGLSSYMDKPSKRLLHGKMEMGIFQRRPYTNFSQKIRATDLPKFMLDLLDSYVFRKIWHMLEKPEEMGLGDFTPVSCELLGVLERLKKSLFLLRDAKLQKLGFPAKWKLLEFQILFESLEHILEGIASRVSGPTSMTQLPLQAQREEALDIINLIYDNSVALDDISMQLETIGRLLVASSEEMAQMGEVEMAEKPLEDPFLNLHTYHETVQSINEESIFKVDNTLDLRNMFDNLPQHLKRCVIYNSSLFPGDKEFQEDTLIQLWTAVGFLRVEPEQLAERGRTYFEELCRLSIFQMSSTVFENYEPTYKVQKDLHKLIQQCFPNEYAVVKEGGPSKISPMTLHCTLLLGDGTHKFDSKMFESFYKAELLRTLKILSEHGGLIKQVLHILFVNLRFLRVLDLSSTKIKELPTSVGNLRHLQYLDVSATPIRKLPESMSKLYKLETLKLRNCLDFVELPKGTSMLIKLKHLDLDGVHQLAFMPPKMGRLTDLQKLSIFIVGTQEGFQIEELKGMKKLRGSLCITNMENVTKDQGDEALLGDKTGIHTLEFQWSSAQSKDEMEFNLIKPHFLIKQLKITRYGAERFPNWLSLEKFCNLTVIHLRNCNCTHLPDLGKLPSLRSLYIHEMYSLTEISHEFYGAFLKLEVLEIDGMPYLKTWTAINMPSLRELTIIDCPKLVTLPDFMNLKSLQHLRITLCPEIQSFPGGSLPKSIQSLTVTECAKLEEQCRKESGNEYYKIAGIPKVWIEYRQMPQTENSEQPTDTVNVNSVGSKFSKGTSTTFMGL